MSQIVIDSGAGSRKMFRKSAMKPRFGDPKRWVIKRSEAGICGS
jgi:hypothetical protein